MRCHRKERASDQTGEQRVRLVEAEIHIDQLQLPCVMGLAEDRTPAAGHSPSDQKHRRESAEKVDARLQHVCPHHRAHPAMVGIDQR